MNKDLNINSVDEILESNKLKEFSNDKLNFAIDVIKKQNIEIIQLKKDEKFLTNSLKESLERIDRIINSYNDTFNHIKNWMDAQNKRNDSVDEVFNDLRIKIESLNNK